MASRKVIVFGPTGAVGSAAARTAAELGATVALAMRDTTKSIPGLDAAKEKQGKFERIQADLTKPDSVRDAVTKSGAKHAFIYAAHAMPDHMKSTIQALKDAGIELVVFLSSFTVRGELKEIAQSDLIAFLHAQVEINLVDIYGTEGYVAVRPGSFSTNTVQYKGGLQSGLVKIFMPEATVDNIVPEDIGRVSGYVLANGPQDDNRHIYLYGPKLVSQEDNVKTLAKMLGKEVKIEVAGQEDAYKMFVEERNIPPPLAEYMVRQLNRTVSGESQVFGLDVPPDHLLNVQKYGGGGKSTTFEEWVEANKALFT